jgi:hypothetical protein
MDEETHKKLKDLEDYATKSEISESFPIYEELRKMNKHLAVLSGVRSPNTENEYHKIEIIGAEVVAIKGDKGDTPKVGIDFEQPKDGKDYILTKQDKKEIASEIKVPIVEKTEVIKEQPIITNEIKEVAKYEEPEQIKNKLLEVGLKIEDIENLQKELDNMKKGIERRPIFGGGGFNYSAMNIHLLDWTTIGTGNDSTTEFTLTHRPDPVSSLEVKVGGGDLFDTDDWTYSASTNKITFLIAPPTGAKIRFKCRI